MVRTVFRILVSSCTISRSNFASCCLEVAPNCRFDNQRKWGKTINRERINSEESLSSASRPDDETLTDPAHQAHDQTDRAAERNVLDSPDPDIRLKRQKNAEQHNGKYRESRLT